MDGDDNCDSCTRSTPRWPARRCPLRRAIASRRPRRSVGGERAAPASRRRAPGQRAPRPGAARRSRSRGPCRWDMNSVDDDGAVRFARAAVDNGGGPEAEIALAWSLLWLGRFVEAVRGRKRRGAQDWTAPGRRRRSRSCSSTASWSTATSSPRSASWCADASGQAAAPRLLLLRIILCLARSDTNGAAALFEELERVDGSRADTLAASGEVAAALAQRGRFVEAFGMTEPYVEFAIEGARRGAVVPASALAARVAAASIRDGPSRRGPTSSCSTT